MPIPQPVAVETNPAPDARSPEEQAIADAVALILGNKMVGCLVGADKPNGPNRFIGVAVALLPWQVRRFNRVKFIIKSTIREIAQEDDVVVEVVRLPMHLTAGMIFLRILHNAGPSRKDKDAVCAETAE